MTGSPELVGRTVRFRDRRDAGRQLARRLLAYRASHSLVLALPRGGVVVGCEVARALGAELDVVRAGELRAPGFLDDVSVRSEQVAAVVSWGGRPDLAGADLRRVRAPTLFIAGSGDRAVTAVNQLALRQLVGDPEKQVIVIPGAALRLEEPGALADGARLTAERLHRHLASARNSLAA